MIHNLNIHGIVSIVVKPETRQERTMYDWMPPYYHRSIIITNRDGRELELNLFGDRDGDLELIIND